MTEKKKYLKRFNERYLQYGLRPSFSSKTKRKISSINLSI
jgi:hypothetical protein